MKYPNMAKKSDWFPGGVAFSLGPGQGFAHMSRGSARDLLRKMKRCLARRPRKPIKESK